VREAWTLLGASLLVAALAASAAPTRVVVATDGATAPDGVADAPEAGPGAADGGRPPNIVFVLADDLGYGELGCYGQERIRTPRLDALAAEGLRFTRHVAGSPVCAPSRCVLLTGLHPGHAQVRDNREVKPEGQHPLEAGTPTIARALQTRGYATGAFGKWGLGPPGSEGDPLAQGFDRFYGYNCQRVAHNYHPTSLWDDDVAVPLDNPDFPAHDTLRDDEDPADPASYARFRGEDYAPDLITEQVLAFVRDHADEPFFLYWPTTVPHLALQVPEDSLGEYAGLWDDPPYPGGKGYLPQFAPRAAYAAMVTRMDRDVGRLLDLLDELDLAGDTLVVFTSDNGPTYDRIGGSDSGFFDSAAGMRGLKGSISEGGVRVPCVVRWPGVVAPGSVSDRLTGFEDWLPTLLDVADAGATSERDRPRTDGLSFVPLLRGEAMDERPFLYREFAGYGGQQAVWRGRWKAVRRDLRKLEAGDAPVTELHDLEADPAETTDVAAAHPEVVAELEALMAREHAPEPDFPLPVLDG